MRAQVKMNTDKGLLIVAIIAVVVSVVGAGITYSFITSFKSRLTGFVSSGVVNLTVESAAVVNFTTDEINWESGRVDDGSVNATLDTSAGANNVTNGNWTGNTAGFVVENIGNNNITFELGTATTAASLIGGAAGGGPEYMYNVTDDTAEDNSCNFTTDGATEGIYIEVNASRSICDVFDFASSNNQLRIDIRIVIPSDSKTGELTDTITATIGSA